jgi:hypothetical protein
VGKNVRALLFCLGDKFRRFQPITIHGAYQYPPQNIAFRHVIDSVYNGSTPGALTDLP